METFESEEEIIAYYEKYLNDVKNTEFEYIRHNRCYYTMYLIRIEQLNKIFDELINNTKKHNTKITIEVKKKQKILWKNIMNSKKK